MADEVVYEVPCDCGHVTRDVAGKVIDAAIAHASEAHDVEVGRDVLWAMAVPSRSRSADGPPS
ncbi:hypothetical protein [Rhabdothermincola sediminis]|uniref:hypothetical protein n=1 Tax=Rhabdothermincola sediminis TaxID=2751370 RepID=UPI001AA08102|nr:hypothetical protein [Rhabdothermincola sediminis]